jgi:hypothetical protein
MTRKDDTTLFPRMSKRIRRQGFFGDEPKFRTKPKRKESIPAVSPREKKENI